MLLLLALYALGVASAQNSLYSSGGCRITGDSVGGMVNVTCACNQFIAQTDQSTPIDELTMTGCAEAADPTVSPPVTTITLTEPRRRLLGSRISILLDVRRLRLSLGRFQLVPVQRRALDHPLTSLEIMSAELSGGLTDSALEGMPNLRNVTFNQVAITAMRPGALVDLPQLETLTIVDSTCTFVNEHSMMQVPRLRQLTILRSEMNFIRTNAFRVDPAEGEEVEEREDACPAPVSGALTSPAEDVATVFISGNNIHAMSRQAMVFRGFHHIVFSNNSVGDMGEQSLDAQLRAPAACPAAAAGHTLLQFADNGLQDVRAEAVHVQNLAASRPAALVLGGNTLLQAALSPLQLRLDGPFRPAAAFARDNPSRYDCECCDCAATAALLDLAGNATAAGAPPLGADAVVDTLTAAVLRAQCVSGDLAFAEFADGCRPGLAAALRRRHGAAGGGADTPRTGTPKSAAPTLTAAAVAGAAVVMATMIHLVLASV